RRATLQGNVGSQTKQVGGCAFADRCPRAETRCTTETPKLRKIDHEHMASCHFA
ncbi:MAG: ABC transporter ATP-binding protein, partial [Rhodospirillaceae bacterium]|nr:ABC transporter ATP-binding protein [Rhodospirillaceae bacterium]